MEITVLSLWFLSLACSLGSALGYLFSIISTAKIIQPADVTAVTSFIGKKIEKRSTVLLGIASHLLLISIPIYVGDLLVAQTIVVPGLVSFVVAYAETFLAFEAIIWLDRKENKGIVWRIILYALKLNFLFYLIEGFIKVREFILTYYKGSISLYA